MILSRQEAQARLIAEAYGEQGPDTDGLAQWFDLPTNPRIAALEAKLDATMADMRSLQRQNENYEAGIASLHRTLDRFLARNIQLEAERDTLRTELAQRMAIPANALRHSR